MATSSGWPGKAGSSLTQLADRIRINNWDEVGFIVLMILGTVALIDIVSRKIRLRIIQPSRYRP